MHKEKKHLSFEEVLAKLMKYCSYQERSEKEVCYKAKELGIEEKYFAELLSALKNDHFVDDERFAEAYVRGKVSQKKWGKYKIIEGLKQKGISQTFITEAISRIDQEKYFDNLNVLARKRNVIDALSSEERSKVYRYLLSKGYESNLILKVIN